MSSQLSGIEFMLNQLLSTVIGVRLELLAKGKTPKPGDVKTPAFFAKLQAIGDRVVPVMRTLKSMEHAQLLRADNLYAVPREARYGARQSIDSQLENVRRVRALAVKLCTELRGAYGDSMTATTADVIEGAQKILNEIGKTVDRAQLQGTAQQVSDGPAFVSAGPLGGAGGLNAVDLLSQVWLLLACVVAITRKK
jgi:hypothetical protein